MTSKNQNNPAMHDYPEEMLNAYLDNELPDAERRILTKALQHNPELQRRLENLRTLRQLIKLAYEDI